MESNFLPVLWRPSNYEQVAAYLLMLPPLPKNRVYLEISKRHRDDVDFLSVLYAKYSYLCCGCSLAMFISFDLFDTADYRYFLALCKFMEEERRLSYVS